MQIKSELLESGSREHDGSLDGMNGKRSTMIMVAWQSFSSQVAYHSIEICAVVVKRYGGLLENVLQQDADNVHANHWTGVCRMVVGVYKFDNFEREANTAITRFNKH